MTKVSILMPVYNAEQYVAQAIRSVLSQSFSDWELILINDGSIDKSESIIKQFDDNRIYYLKNSSNIGLIKTLNKGIDLCQGKYIARMDADDISHPDRLKYQVDFMERNPSYLMCGTDAAVIDNDDTITGKIRNFTNNRLLKINLLFTTPFIHPSVMVKRETLSENKYDESYKHVEDFELWCRIAKLGDVANISKDLIRYRWHNTNVSVVNNRIQGELKKKIITDELVTALDIYPSEKELYCHLITFNLYRMGNKLDISVGDFDDIANWFSKLIRQNNEKEVYSKNDLIAFLWARWFVLCISQKKRERAFSPSFASYNLLVLWKLFKILFFFRKK
ncbi:MAG: glycosyltransferase [Dysgonomonas sp.]|nr:glycosyltransferase [Dysgonomonas sp.]